MRAESDAARYVRPTDAIENSAMKMVDILVIATARAQCSCQGSRGMRHQLTLSSHSGIISYYTADEGFNLTHAPECPSLSTSILSAIIGGLGPLLRSPLSILEYKVMI